MTKIMKKWPAFVILIIVEQRFVTCNTKIQKMSIIICIIVGKYLIRWKWKFFYDVILGTFKDLTYAITEK